RMLRPIEVLFAGKVTAIAGGAAIPVVELQRRAAWQCLRAAYPLLTEADVAVHDRTTATRGAGRPAAWYAPDDFDALRARPPEFANDSVICCAYAPLSGVERYVLELEERLSSGLDRHPCTGADIKVLAQRIGAELELTLAVPAVASVTHSRSHYDQLKEAAVDIARGHAGRALPELQLTEVRVNTRDDEENVYMSHLGGALDTGDVGVVGRGNRLNGLIAPGRETSIEAPHGKNPLNHGGKIYAVSCRRLAEAVHKQTGAEVYVTIVTETGRRLEDPLHIAIKVENDPERHRRNIEDLVEEEREWLRDLKPELLTL
ncbi:MAG TPA: methionine adenosyltransferase, partial [Solirubrobacteraceae bacterium]|nr:methionine adenosyltransferase [Solirubrobacteraceae bacterium]